MRGVVSHLAPWHSIMTILCIGMTLTACGSNDAGEDREPAASPAIREFAAERTRYFVGEQARITAVFEHGTARLEPGDIPVVSGQVITTPALTRNIRYRLTVTHGTASVSRDLDLEVAYRERTRALDMPFARAAHAAIALDDGRVAIIGGEDDSFTFPAAMYAFDPATESFSLFGMLSSGRVGFTATALYDGNVLIAGGQTTLPTAPRAEIVDGVTGAVAPTPSGPKVPRLYAAAILLMDGRVLLSGGLIDSARIADSLEIYDPATGEFSLLPGTLQVARADHSMIRIDERHVLVYGGVAAGYAAPPPELFDVQTATATLLAAPESHVRYNPAVHTLPDGGIALIGGEGDDGFALHSVLHFDPATQRFGKLLDLATPRAAARVARIADDRMLVTGGTTRATTASVTATTELISNAGQRTEGPTMIAARHHHSVTSLRNGKVLIVGGLNAAGWPHASAEIFE